MTQRRKLVLENIFKKNVYEYIKKNNMISDKDTVVLGVSGGADSVCLFYVMLDFVEKQKKEGKIIELKVVHVNHMIRDTADRDEEFVKKLCEKHGVSFCSVREDVLTYAKDNHLSTEEAGRKIRYDAFFNSAKDKEDGKIVVAVAHNLNDNAETIIFNMFRGSGIKGLMGISPVACDAQGNKIVRPLLNETREDIEAFLKCIGQEFVTDETNLTDDYTRNVIRNNIFPQVCQRINSKAIENVVSAGGFVGKAYDFIQKIVDKEYKEIVQRDDEKMYFDRDRFLILEEIIGDELIKKAMVDVCGQAKDLTQIHIKSTREVFVGEKNREINLPYGMVACNVYGKIWIQKEIEEKEEEQVVDVLAEELEKKGELIVSFKEEKYSFKLIDLKTASKSDKTYIKNIINEKNNYTKCFDYGKIVGSLVLRNRRNGDYLTISKDGNRKKLKSIFIDNKIEPKVRQRCSLLAVGSEVLWIVSMRTGCSAYVDENTERVLVVSKL